MTTSNDPDQIRAEIERTQANLSHDVDVMTEKVSPGRIVERRMNRVRDTASRWKDTVMGSAPHTGPYDTGPYDTGHRARAATQHATGQVSGTARDVAGSVGDAASSATSEVARAAQEAPVAVRRQAQGNPLAAGLVAFGAGMLISSLLPASRRERQLAEQAVRQASEQGRPVAEAAKQAATEVQENLSGPGQEAVESVRSTATQAGQTVADEGRAAARDVQGESRDAASNVRQGSS